MAHFARPDPGSRGAIFHIDGADQAGAALGSSSMPTGAAAGAAMASAAAAASAASAAFRARHARQYVAM